MISLRKTLILIQVKVEEVPKYAIPQWNIYMRFPSEIFRFCLDFYASALSRFKTSVEYKQCHVIRLSGRFNEEILIKRLLKNCGPLKIIQIGHH